MAKSIQKEVKEETLRIVDQFNKEHNTSFRITFRGQFAYLNKSKKQDVGVANTFRQRIAAKMGIAIKNIPDQDAPIVETKLGRLKYNGSINDWSFAVFKYSREVYDPDEFMFPGSGKLDGTVQRALKAGMELYPS
ncbi:MAG: hypothetical protein ACI828_002587 [Flavobacteriales bacterium]|jgi:hypothetical protein